MPVAGVTMAVAARAAGVRAVRERPELGDRDRGGGDPWGDPKFLWSQAAQDGRLIGCAGDGEEGATVTAVTPP